MSNGFRKYFQTWKKKKTQPQIHAIMSTHTLFTLNHTTSEVSKTVKQPILFIRNETKIKVKIFFGCCCSSCGRKRKFRPRCSTRWKKNGQIFLLFISLICFSFHSFLLGFYYFELVFVCLSIFLLFFTIVTRLYLWVCMLVRMHMYTLKFFRCCSSHDSGPTIETTKICEQDKKKTQKINKKNLPFEALVTCDLLCGWITGSNKKWPLPFHIKCR